MPGRCLSTDGRGFEAKESTVRLQGWSRQRRVIVLRQRLKGAVGLSQSEPDGTPQLSFVEIGEATEVYEYSVLVTSLVRGVAKNAEQLTRLQRWQAILSRAFQAFLNGRLLRPPPRLAPS